MADGMVGAKFSYEGFKVTAPDSYAALLALSGAAKAAGLDQGLLELVKLRVSQLNGCAFCLAYHLGLARAAGVPAQKLELLAAWRGAKIFAPRERAALEWAELLTQSPEQGPPALAGLAAQDFTADEIMFLTVAVAAINAWNRVAGGLGF